MHSMTGFGRAEKQSALGWLTVELSSVNNRFLEFSFRLPRAFQPLEAQLRELIGKHVRRGKVTMTLSFEPPEDSPSRFHINRAAAKSYARQLRKIQKELKLGGEVTISDLVILPDIARPQADELGADEAWRALEPIVKKGLVALASMRKKEGAAMSADMKSRLLLMEKYVAEVEKKSKGSVKKQAAKLAERIKAITDRPKLDPYRLEQEVAFFADRTDITEECTRFRSHLGQYRGALKQREPVGRRLNFILQEMNREVNTIGSKSAEFGISSSVISLKEELEKLREQVQNVE